MPNIPGDVQYPELIDSVTTLIETKNFSTTTLATGITASAITIPLVSATSFPNSGAIAIEKEIIYYTGKTGNSLTGCMRGSDGTNAVSHVTGVAVEGRIISSHHQVLVEAILRLEAKLGIGDSLPESGQFLRSSANGVSDWTPILIEHISGLEDALENRNHVHHQMNMSFRTLAESSSLLVTDNVVYCNANSNNVDLTLPDATNSSGLHLIVKRTDTSIFNVTLTGINGQKIDNVNSVSLLGLDGIHVSSDGFNWWIL